MKRGNDGAEYKRRDEEKYLTKSMLSGGASSGGGFGGRDRLAVFVAVDGEAIVEDGVAVVGRWFWAMRDSHHDLPGSVPSGHPRHGSGFKLSWEERGREMMRNCSVVGMDQVVSMTQLISQLEFVWLLAMLACCYFVRCI